MQAKIKNREELTASGIVESRRVVLQVAEETLAQLDAGKRIRDLMALDGDILRIGQLFWDLSRKKNIYLIGAGKACNSMVKAVEDILGDRLTEGGSVKNCV